MKTKTKTKSTVARRRVKRRQERVSHKKLRTLRSRKYARKTARKVMRKVMRGGGVINIYLEGNNNEAAITLKMDKNKFSSGYTLEIEINLNLYPYDVRMLLNSLFMKLGTEQLYSPSEIRYDKYDIPVELRFLLGLADIPERDGTLAYAREQFESAQTDADKNEAQILLDKITQSYDNKKCVVVIELSQTGNDILFTVTEYSRIKTETVNMKHTYSEFDENAGSLGDEDDFGIRQPEGANVTKTEIIPVCYPKLDMVAPAKPKFGGINMIAYKPIKTTDDKLIAVPPRCVEGAPTDQNENTFTAKNMSIEEFVSKLNTKNIQLKINDTKPEILLSTQGQNGIV